MQRAAWVLGTLNIASSIGMKGYAMHSGKITTEAQKSVNIASNTHFMNGVGLCLLGLKAGSNVALPLIMLKMGTVMFCYVVYYQRVYGDYTFRRLVPIGGSLTLLGWVAMAFV